MTQVARGSLIDSEGGADRRSNERHRVVFRTAKLLLADHDCFCIMRDISSSGMKLQLFGPIDGIDTVDIEFLGGHVVRMHKRWARGDHCGFEFENSVDIAALIALPTSEFDRRPQRLRMNAPAAIDVAGEVLQVRLRDISLAGARIAVARRLRASSELRIGIDGLGRKKADIRWWREGFAGLHFHAPLAFNELAAWSATLPELADAGD
ncbi:PilZ domain-containing protein [Novosphingopyxis sp.]|uniref:PilZ domain-containing protein n=1 Tax=Novosphingopyxis sp. TaxID=2709690 RepID=UPI003B5CEC89